MSTDAESLEKIEKRIVSGVITKTVDGQSMTYGDAEDQIARARYVKNKTKSNRPFSVGRFKSVR